MKRVFSGLLLSVALFMTSCGGSSTEVKDGVVEVICFKSTQRVSAVASAIESLTQKVVDSEFKEELESGDLVFMSVDISTDEGKQIAADYFDGNAPAVVVSKWTNGEKELFNFTSFAKTTVVKSPDKFKKVIGIKVEELLK